MSINETRNINHMGDLSDNLLERLMPFLATDEEEKALSQIEAGLEEEKKRKLEKLKIDRLVKSGFGIREINAAMKHEHPKFKAIMDQLSESGIAFIFGDCGEGKTVLACKCALNWEKKSVRYIRALDFFLGIKDCWRKDSSQSEKAFVDSIKKPSLLVIDEIQDRSDNSQWEENLLTNVIDYRYSNMLATIIISNKPISDTKDGLTRSIVSRVQETGAFFSMAGGRFRAKSINNQQ